MMPCPECKRIFKAGGLLKCAAHRLNQQMAPRGEKSSGPTIVPDPAEEIDMPVPITVQDFADKEIWLRELTGLINKHSKENASNTPDWILAKFLNGCLESFNVAAKDLDTWKKT